MSDTDTITNKLGMVQQELRAPKNETGRFGAHRSTEGILKALKPVLERHGLSLIMSDEIVNVGERNYVKATVSIFDNGGGTADATAYAWEGEVSRGLDASQVTGIASSYARKYALGGLFAIDDNKDADSTEYGDEPAPATQKPAVGAVKPQSAPQATRRLVTEAQVKLLLARSRDASGLQDRQEVYDFFLEEFKVMPNEVYQDEVDSILKKLSGEEAA